MENVARSNNPYKPSLPPLAPIRDKVKEITKKAKPVFKVYFQKEPEALILKPNKEASRSLKGLVSAFLQFNGNKTFGPEKKHYTTYLLGRYNPSRDVFIQRFHDKIVRKAGIERVKLKGFDAALIMEQAARFHEYFKICSEALSSYQLELYDIVHSEIKTKEIKRHKKLVQALENYSEALQYKIAKESGLPVPYRPLHRLYKPFLDLEEELFKGGYIRNVVHAYAVLHNGIIPSMSVMKGASSYFSKKMLDIEMGVSRKEDKNRVRSQKRQEVREARMEHENATVLKALELKPGMGLRELARRTGYSKNKVGRIKDRL